MDALIYQTPDGGEINIDAEGVETTDGLESAAYLSLANGSGWWGDSIQPDEASQYPCAFLDLIDGIPATPGNLRRLESAAKTDLAAIPADSIEVVATVQGAKRVHVAINIDESKTEYTENWESMKPKFQAEFTPAVKPPQSGVEIGGRIYSTVVIGDLEWMSENLAYETDDFKYPKGDSDNKEAYGLLYNLDGANNLIPEGWRLPTQSNFLEIAAHIGADNGDVTKELKLNDATQWSNDANRGLDPYGFSAQSAGLKYSTNSYYNFNSVSYLWSSTAGVGSGKLVVDIANNSTTFSWASYDDLLRYFSIRYVRDI